MKSALIALTLAGLSGLASSGCTASAGVAPSPPATDVGCEPDQSVSGCSGGASGFSCGNGDTPDHADSSLVCSDGIEASDGFVDFCCVQFTSSSCQPDSSVPGCDRGSIGFSCTGSDRPDDADSSLVCSDPAPGNGLLLYCCAP